MGAVEALWQEYMDVIALVGLVAMATEESQQPVAGIAVGADAPLVEACFYKTGHQDFSERGRRIPQHVLESWLEQVDSASGRLLRCERQWQQTDGSVQAQKHCLWEVKA